MSENVVLLGYGSIARIHAEAIRQLQGTPDGQGIQLYGVMGRDAGATEDFARKFGMQLASTELDEVLADPSVDVVLICSPSDVHFEQAERSLRAGKHVLCEIPMATSLAETDRLIQAVQETGRTFMVCHTQRFYRGLMEARRMLAEGELHAHALACRHIRLRRENVNWKGRRRTWTDNLLWHHGCHSVDTALWLFGATESDVPGQVALPSGHLDIPMDLTIVLRTPRDQIATIVMSYNSHFNLHDYLVMGEETSVLWEEDQLRTPERVLVGDQHGSALEAGAVVRQNAEFFAAVREGREPSVSARSARPAMAALQAVQDILDARLAELGPEARHPDLP
jgi:2-hydroxy-4-carboxymuconate semialdehyde hemiacetal dehydrogenase